MHPALGRVLWRHWQDWPRHSSPSARMVSASAMNLSPRKVSCLSRAGEAADIAMLKPAAAAASDTFQMTEPHGHMAVHIVQLVFLVRLPPPPPLQSSPSSAVSPVTGDASRQTSAVALQCVAHCGWVGRC